jgi:mannitol-specific phosphotransferase system IIBC component
MAWNAPQGNCLDVRAETRALFPLFVSVKCVCLFVCLFVCFFVCFLCSKAKHKQNAKTHTHTHTTQAKRKLDKAKAKHKQNGQQTTAKHNNTKSTNKHTCYLFVCTSVAWALAIEVQTKR